MDINLEYYKIFYYITIFIMFIYYILLLTMQEGYPDYNALYVVMQYDYNV